MGLEPTDKTSESKGISGIISGIAKILDRPLVDFFITKNIQPVNAPELEELKLPAASLQKNARTFAALVNSSAIEESTGNKQDPALNLKEKVTFFDCIKKTFELSLKAGKIGLVTKFTTSALSAAVPYVNLYLGAKLIDSLTQIGTNPNASTQAYQYFCAVTLVTLGSYVIGEVGSYARMIHEKNKQILLSEESRRALSSFPPNLQLSPDTTYLVNRAMRASNSISSFGTSLLDLVTPLTTTVGAVAVISQFSPLGAGMVGIFAVPYLYHFFQRGRDEYNLDSAISEKESRFYTRDGLATGQPQVTVRLSGKTEELNSHLAEESKKLKDLRLLPQLKQMKRNYWLESLNILSTSAVGFVVLQNIVDATASGLPGPSIGQYGLIAGTLASLNQGVKHLANTIGRTIQDFPTVKLAVSVLKEGLSHSDDYDHGIELKLEKAPAINIKDVYFSYPPRGEAEGLEVLKGVSFDIKPGELLAVVGESGTGKSSLAQIFSGIYEPSSGTIELNGKPLSEYKKRSLWANCGFFRQMSSNFYSMTIRENILIGAQKTLSDEEIMNHARENGFEKVMLKNNLTLDTIIGQWYKNGTDLSGGEHARLSLTRQAASNAKFLIFDEPTNGLDPDNSEMILDRIKNLKDVTRIVIIHDFGIAATADRILIMKDGKADDIGTHHELVERCDSYRRAFEREQRLLRLLG